MDNYLLHAAGSLPQAWLPVILFTTSLGSANVLVPVVLIYCAIALYRQQPRQALAQALSLTALPLYYVAKILIHRARPASEMVAKLGLHDYSFPSGHSTGSFAVYMTLAYLLFKELPSPWSYICAAGLGILVLLIGFSRVYLQVHYPSDVLGGWALGALTFWGIHYLLKRRVG